MCEVNYDLGSVYRQEIIKRTAFFMSITNGLSKALWWGFYEKKLGKTQGI